MAKLDLSGVNEIRLGVADQNMLDDDIRMGCAVLLKGRRPVIVGNNYFVKVMTLLGVSIKSRYADELSKADYLSTVSYRPDAIMDLSLVESKEPLWRYLLDVFDGAVGIVPYYLSFNKSTGIDKNECLDRIRHLAESGISFFTLHPTATLELFELSRQLRKNPTTARGGGMILRDMRINDRKVNFLEDCFPDILGICKQNNVAISIGSTFRPSNIFEALDEAHYGEIKRQGIFIKEAKDAGVQVIMEGIGHIRLSSLQDCCNLISNYNVPFMPLGPIPTDSAIGFDHVSSAIGASYMAMKNCAHMINSVTREEHTGKVPCLESIIEGLKSARVAAHAVNISKFPIADYVDRSVVELRSKNRTCIIGGGLFNFLPKVGNESGCERCSTVCPLSVK